MASSSNIGRATTVAHRAEKTETTRVFTSSNGELVTETTEGHQVFPTPPCPGQRRLATVAPSGSEGEAAQLTYAGS